jgi:hypothetical protein
VYEGTKTIKLNGTEMLFVKPNLPPVLYLQCSMSPFMGCIVVVMDPTPAGIEYPGMGSGESEGMPVINALRESGQFTGANFSGGGVNFDKSCLASGTCLSGRRETGAEIYA